MSASVYFEVTQLSECLLADFARVREEVVRVAMQVALHYLEVLELSAADHAHVEASVSVVPHQ